MQQVKKLVFSFIQDYQFWFTFGTLNRGEFRTQSNIYNGNFLPKELAAKVVNYFYKESSIADV